MGARAFLLGSLAFIVVACSSDRSPESIAHTPSTNSESASSAAMHTMARHPSAVASLPDRGRLLAYDTRRTTVRKGAATWYPVQLSEEHALRAIETGDLTLDGPKGQPIHLQYQRHLEHEDGNWTWIGREAGGRPGEEAILTFGANAVFGSIPTATGAMQLTTLGKSAWLVESSAAAQSDVRSTESDYLSAPAASAIATQTKQAPRTAAADVSAAATEANTIDVVLGYTHAFADRLGGQSQAETRLAFLVDVANQALSNSQVDAAIRIAKTVQVEYPDSSSNRSTLFELSGVQCTSAAGGQLPDGGVACNYVGPPAALQPLVAARNQSRADLVALVRIYDDTTQGSCGIAWLLGNGQTPIDRNSASFAYSVVSDSSGGTGATCRDETLVHELGHNLGLQHDREIAQGSDDSNGDGNLLDPEEFGRYPYAFGYVGTNFYTIMAPRRAGFTGYRVFSNPMLSTCGGAACGVADVADDARALRQTIPVVATFRSSAQAALRIHNDVNGDGKSDLIWWNATSGVLSYWVMNGPVFSGGKSTFIGTGHLPSTAGQSTLSGRSDVLMRRQSDQKLLSYRSQAQGLTPFVIGGYDPNWNIVGQGDIDGDGRDDIFWRHPTQGYFAYWLMNGAVFTGGQSYTPPAAYQIAAIEDFTGDGLVDIVWNSPGARQMSIWISTGGGFTVRQIGQYGADWQLVGAEDVTGDGKADLLWRNTSKTYLAYWRMDGATYLGAFATPTPADFELAALGDYNGDGIGDVVWERPADRRLFMWLGNGTNFGQYNIGQHSADWVLQR